MRDIKQLLRLDSRVASGMLANVCSQVVTIISWLGTVPVFLYRWTPDKYGHWLVISAIPVYLTVADVGILTAAANLMTMHRARGEINELNVVFKSTLVIICLLVPSILVLTGIALLLFRFGMSVDQRWAIFAITLCSLLTVACGLFDAAYRSFGKYPRVTILLSGARLLELAGMIAGIFIGGSLTSVAVGFLCGRALAFIILYVLARQEVPEVKWSLHNADWGFVKRLIGTGSGFVSFAFNSLIMLQGMVLLVGAELGAIAVAVFASSRTLSRLLSQIAGLAAKALAPEISVLHGTEQYLDVERLSRRTTRLVMSVTLVGAAVLAVAGRYILFIWTDGKLGFDPDVFYLLLATAVTAAYWQLRSVALTATNQHQLLASMCLVASLGGLVFAYFGMHRLGLEGAAAGAFLAEFLMVIGTAFALSRVKRFQMLQGS